MPDFLRPTLILATLAFVVLVQAPPAEAQSSEQDRAYCENRNDAYSLARQISGCTALIRLNPQYADAFYNRGSAYYDQYDYASAIADFDQAIRLNPQDAAAFHNRGKANYRQQNYVRAIADYDQAIRLSPQYAAAFLSRGAAYEAQQNSARAIADYDQAIRLNPQYADAFYNRGAAYYDQQNYARAIADFDRAIRLNPQDADAFYNRSLSYRALGDLARADADHREAIRLDPSLAHNNSVVGGSSGTGFLVTTTGLIVTSDHVIGGFSRVFVVTAEGRVPATIIARDPVNDIAVLRAAVDGTPLRLTSAGASQRGEDVMTLGFPLVDVQGENQRATFGRINALTGIEDDVRFLQVDVPIQPGNSGGPLLNLRGEVIGIVTATLDQLVVLRRTGSLPQNVNYAIKSDYILPLIPSHERPSTGRESRSRPFAEIAASAEASVFRIIVE